MMLTVILTFSFISCSKHKGFKKTGDGLYYKFHVKGDDTTTVRPGMIVNIKLKYSINDSLLFNSDEIPDDFVLPVNEPTYKGDLYTSLTMMHPGDSATFITPADSFFLKTLRMPKVPDSAYVGKDLIFNIKLIYAKTQQQLEAEHRTKLDEMKNEEQTLLRNYLTSSNITVAPLPSGLIFMETKKGNGQKPNVGDYGKVHLRVSKIDGTELFSSFEQAEPMMWESGKDFDNKGVTEALNLMSKGSKASIIVPSSLAFGEQGRNQIVPPYTTLLYDLELVDIVTKAQFEKEKADKERKAVQEREVAKKEESTKLQEYLKNNRINVTPTSSGLYYIEQQKGSGAKAAFGKTVKVNYTGYLINGKEFDSSKGREPLSFVLGQGQVISGWEEGISLMNVGGKARLIIPSKLGYGESGQPPVIPPSATLIFDVELVDVK